MGLQPDIIVAYTHNISDGGIRVHKLPRAGETVRALEGGLGIDGAKGTNVAVAASRAGAKVALVAHVQGGAWFDRAESFCGRKKSTTGLCSAIRVQGRSPAVLLSMMKVTT